MNFKLDALCKIWMMAMDNKCTKLLKNMLIINVKIQFLIKALTWYEILSFNAFFTALWIRDFIKVWIKMSQNGYGSKELVQGPKQFWTHF